MYGVHLCCVHPTYSFQKKTQDATTSNCISGQKLKTKTMSLVRGKCDKSPSLQFAPWRLLLPPPVGISALAWLGSFNLKILPPKAKPHVIACHCMSSFKIKRCSSPLPVSLLIARTLQTKIISYEYKVSVQYPSKGTFL